MFGQAALISTFLLAFSADSAEQAFAQAMQEKQPGLARKLFAESARHYGELHADGVNNPILFRNWGNAELLADRVPQSILAYRRGLRLDPGNADLLDNLFYARSRVHYPPDSQPPLDDSRWSALAHWLPWLPRYMRTLWFIGTILLYTLACLAGLRWYAVRRTWLPGRAMLLLILAGSCGFYWQREEAQLREEQEHPLVVIARDVGFFRGNGDTYPRHEKMPVLHAGMEARRLFQRGDWLQIQLPDGATGWVPHRAVLVDEQESP